MTPGSTATHPQCVFTPLFVIPRPSVPFRNGESEYAVTLNAPRSRRPPLTLASTEGGVGRGVGRGLRAMRAAASRMGSGDGGPAGLERTGTGGGVAPRTAISGILNPPRLET